LVLDLLVLLIESGVVVIPVILAFLLPRWVYCMVRRYPRNLILVSEHPEKFHLPTAQAREGAVSDNIGNGNPVTTTGNLSQRLSQPVVTVWYFTSPDQLQVRLDGTQWRYASRKNLIMNSNV
jgi:hypothetical protein